jgi:anti-anti-sigma regulatory factor
MILVTSNKSKQLLHVSYVGQVRAKELEELQKDLKVELGGLSPGFRVLMDLSSLESMELECVPWLGRAMELIDQAGVDLIARVIPDPHKDIGFNILTIFHYARRPQTATCKNVVEACRTLGL